MRFEKLALTTLFVAAALACADNAAAITAGLLTDFNIDAQGWSNNGGTSHYLTDGGPLGAGDGYVDVTSSGASQGGGSRIVIDNSDDWAGDYLTAGVTAIQFDANNFSDGDMLVRLAFRAGGDTSVFVTEEVVLPANSGWQHLNFELAESRMDVLGDNYVDTFSNVSRLRLIHRVNPSVSNGGPADAGDMVINGGGMVVPGRLGIDNLRAIAVPEPGAAVLVALCGLTPLGRRNLRR